MLNLESDWFSAIVICFFIGLPQHYSTCPIWPYKKLVIGQVKSDIWVANEKWVNKWNVCSRKTSGVRHFRFRNIVFAFRIIQLIRQERTILFFCIEKSKNVDLGILKTSYFSKFLAFCHFVIDTINWKWDFVSYNSRVIGLVISNQPSASPDYFQNCTPLSPITITYTFSSSNHLSCWASASRSIRSVVSSFSMLIVEAVGLGGWNTQN